MSHVSARSCTCACMYVSMTYVRICIYVLGFMCLAASHESYTRLYTHMMLLHIVLLLARRHRYSGAMCPHVRTYAHMFYLGLRLTYVGLAMRATRAYIATHKRCCCTLCYCSTTPSLLVHDDTVRTKLLALQTDSSA